ncbi:amidohydrolase family protein [Cryobacterium mannosilyticum]|uniref:Amidohydrolase n=1 Tax=Cryobacterium mannosilyticum TaxID=1259190 RepID=A0A4R8WEA5_9MICO|nr:amidohydrolase family protein [Cryobacterium mannosilyticum]TFC04891.1 amidohydrolase [Cryobacterium mannosilyticum]
MSGTVFPGFLDAHVHLALIDPAGLASNGIARVLDLGGPHRAPETDADGSGPQTAFAGQFLTTPGGYPARQGWTPAGSVCEVARATDAAAAVDRQLAAGASVIKVTLNTAAGPVLPGDVLAAIVARAHERGVLVVAHAEGAGQAGDAYAAGVDVLAHTPFDERLDDDLIAAMAGRMTWISTLDIHGWGRPTDDFARASDNLRRFHAAGGQVLYGTDLGNGPLPVGLNRRELDALLACGLSPGELLRALTRDSIGRFPGALPRTGAGLPATVIPGERPGDPGDFTRWLCTARVVPAADAGEVGHHGSLPHQPFETEETR